MQGTYSFDDMLLSIMNIFQVITLEGWTDMMYIVRDAERTFSYDLFFILCVILGTFVILNLMVAVQASYLDSAFDEEDMRQKELKEKLELKRKFQKQECEDFECHDHEIEEDEFHAHNLSHLEEEHDPHEHQDTEVDANGNKVTSSKRKDKGCCRLTKP